MVTIRVPSNRRQGAQRVPARVVHGGGEHGEVLGHLLTSGLRSLAGGHLLVDEVTVEHVSRFVAWLRAPADNVAVLAPFDPVLTDSAGWQPRDIDRALLEERYLAWLAPLGHKPVVRARAPFCEPVRRKVWRGSSVQWPRRLGAAFPKLPGIAVFDHVHMLDAEPSHRVVDKRALSCKACACHGSQITTETTAFLGRAAVRGWDRDVAS